MHRSTPCSMIHNMLDQLLAFLFPAHCVGCGKKDTPACNQCIRGMFQDPRINHPTSVLSLGSYQNKKLRSVLWRLKYKNGRIIARIIAPHAASVVERALPSDNTPCILTGVPATAKRIRQRGFNQAEYLAQAIAGHLPAHVSFRAGIVIKTRDTLPQTQCASRKDRIKNLRGVFSLSPDANVQGAYCVVVDDITTTGTTLAEVSGVLRAAGAQGVLCVAIARQERT